MIIAISGQPGSGSSTISKILARELNINHMSPGQIYKDIARGIAQEQFYFGELNLLIEREGLSIPRMSETNDSSAAINFWNTNLGKSEILHKIIDELQIRYAKRGNIIIDGKLSLHMLKDSAFKIWFKADIIQRAKRSANRDNISLEKSKLIIEGREAMERKEWMRIYGIDYFSQEDIADLVIDTSVLKPEEIVNKILLRLEKENL